MQMYAHHSAFRLHPARFPQTMQAAFVPFWLSFCFKRFLLMPSIRYFLWNPFDLLFRSEFTFTSFQPNHVKGLPNKRKRFLGSSQVSATCGLATCSSNSNDGPSPFTITTDDLFGVEIAEETLLPNEILEGSCYQTVFPPEICRLNKRKLVSCNDMPM